MGAVKFPENLAKFQKAKFFASKGVVTECRVWSSTHVYGDGGGTAEAMQVKVRSDVHEHREFHLRDGGYSEIISLVDVNFPVAVGNVVSVICIRDMAGRNHYVEGINHSTGSTTAIERDIPVAGGAGTAIATLFWVAMVFVGFFMQAGWFFLYTRNGAWTTFNPGSLIVALLGLALMVLSFRKVKRGGDKLTGQDANIESRIGELRAYLDQVPVTKAAAE
ncbi:MAG: hypothetical protein FD176_175 [Rhodospirillaceae bacterium]|nr:MAG: hypothetical protein FD176_175 [Rhodospirillaceae bacterium]TNC98693.1 MAG: hypothetical protein FD119_164 [Stygiobacter sp.]